jgi:hypothetical protein
MKESDNELKTYSVFFEYRDKDDDESNNTFIPPHWSEYKYLTPEKLLVTAHNEKEALQAAIDLIYRFKPRYWYIFRNSVRVTPIESK